VFVCPKDLIGIHRCIILFGFLDCMSPELAQLQSLILLEPPATPRRTVLKKITPIYKPTNKAISMEGVSPTQYFGDEKTGY